MSIIIGIDVGGSTTKIAGFKKQTLLDPMTVKANDPIASIYGAFGKYTDKHNIKIEEITCVMITGVGSTYIKNSIYGIPSCHVDEFTAIGRGGAYLTGYAEAIVISMGTGTALVHHKNGKSEYLGGTGVGGGTLMGLTKKTINMQNVEQISKLAEEGNLENIDLKIKDITAKNIIPTLPQKATAANFGKVSDVATNADYALGIINLIFETVGMMGVFAARGRGLKDIVLTGNLSSIKHCGDVFKGMSEMFGINFCIPKNSQFATVIGAALIYFDEK